MLPPRVYMTIIKKACFDGRSRFIDWPLALKPTSLNHLIIPFRPSYPRQTFGDRSFLFYSRDPPVLDRPPDLHLGYPPKRVLPLSSILYFFFRCSFVATRIIGMEIIQYGLSRSRDRFARLPYLQCIRQKGRIDSGSFPRFAKTPRKSQ